MRAERGSSACGGAFGSELPEERKPRRAAALLGRDEGPGNKELALHSPAKWWPEQWWLRFLRLEGRGLDFRRHIPESTLIFLLVTASAGAVQANMVLPSVVDVVASPLLSSIWLVTIPLSLLTLLGISFIEALVLKRLLPSVTPLRVMAWLVLLNAITSVTGAFMGPFFTTLFPGMFIAYGLTVVAEGLLLHKIPFALGMSLARRMVVSLGMNTASYAVLGLVLAALVYGPGWRTRDATLQQEARGTVIVESFQALRLDTGRLHLEEIAPFRPMTAAGNGKAIAFEGGKAILVAFGKTGFRQEEEVTFSDHDLLGVSPALDRAAIAVDGCLQVVNREGQQLPTPSGLVADGWPVRFSHSGRYLATYATQRDSGTHRDKGGFVLVEGGKVTALDAWVYPHAYAFNPATDELAWIAGKQIAILDPATGKLRTLRLSARYDRPQTIAWSPDGRLLVSTASMNPFVGSGLSLPRLTIWSADGSRWCPLGRHDYMGWGADPLVWVRGEVR